MNPIYKYAFINSILTGIYVALVGMFFYFAPVIFDAKDKPDTVFIPIAMLLLFVLSATICGALVLGRPILWYLEGKKKEALTLFGYTLAGLFVLTIVAFATMFAYSYYLPAKKDMSISYDKSEIALSSKSLLSINDFPDEIKVSADASFGESDRIKDAVLSPKGDWIAVAVGGAAHDFGWVYQISTKKLTPVIFSYGGGVAIKGWTDSTHVVFTVTTPKPETGEVTVDVEHLPQYPL